VPGHTIDTASGRSIDFDAPDPSQIRIEDIAGGLSRICRFAAQALRFHSVAQHAVLVSDLLIGDGREDLALTGLHHDSHEAYVCDIPAPLKRKLRARDERAYDEVCEALDAAIGEALGLPSLSEVDHTTIKAADNCALMLEAASLLPDGGRAIAKSTDLAVGDPAALGRSLSPDESRELFLDTHRRLIGSG
jgi:uncharacterized protein